MDRRWHSGGAHRPWAFADRTDIPGFPVRRKTLRKAECSVLGKAHQWACYFAHALFPYWRVRQSAGRRIHSVSVHNGPAADAAFTGCFGICASSAQSPTLLVSLGIVRDKEQRGDLYLILSILVLFAASSIILYYIGWNNV